MIYGSWDIKHDRQNFLSFRTIFCPFTPPPPTPNNSENQSFQKMKKTPRDIIILRKRTINGSWDMKCTRHIFFVILGHFFLFYSLKKWKFQKNEKNPGDIIILHKFTKIHDHMLYCSWDMACDRCIVIFHSGLYFFLFTNEKKWNSPKHENFKKMEKKKAWRYHFMQIMITYYAVPEIWHVKHVIVIFHFGLFFALLPPSPLSPTWRYHFTHTYRKLWLVDVRFLRYGERRTVGRTDGRTDGKGDI